MMLRPRQAVFADRCCEALATHGNTLGIAPTGAGKTVMLSAVAGRTIRDAGGRGLILQHRDELVTQNARTFRRMHPRVEVTAYVADRKRWSRDGITFGMIQSVVNGLSGMPRMDFLGIDEAHHATSDGYLQVIGMARDINPDIKIFGVTATPTRGDKRGLNAVFSNVGDAITIGELIASGDIVPPRAFVVDVGVREQLNGVRKLLSDFDMEAVARIMDQRVVNDRVVEEWKKVAGDRQTAVFCANIEHATHVTDAFRAAGVSVANVDGKMPAGTRKRLLAAFDRGEIQVMVNVAVLTEGWDCQTVSCVVLLRPSSFKSTMTQMIGRGLRKVDPERHPGVEKVDCVVLDFGTSILTHGSIETETRLGNDDTKECPQCHATLPGSCLECPLCGYAFPKDTPPPPTKICDDCGAENALNRRTCVGCGKLLLQPNEKGELQEFVLTEVDLFKQSPFKWEELWDGAVLVAQGASAWGACVHYRGAWYAVGGREGERGIKLLAAGQERLVALASGDDWMREHGDPSQSGKTKSWLSMAPTDRQLDVLNLARMQAIGLTRYKASCLMTWKWADKAIRARVEAAHAAHVTHQATHHHAGAAA